jgi:predicted AAA+ superfamily ATPase
MTVFDLILEISKENLQLTTSEIIISRQGDLEFTHNKVLSLIGVRRCGKSFIQKKIIQTLYSLKNNYESVLYLNFEDDRISGLNYKEIGEAISKYFAHFPQPEKKYIFFDEIQNLENWEKLVRRLLDQKHSISITGSSAKALSKEIATALRGRSLSQEVYPLSFKEWLLFSKQQLLLKKIETGTSLFRDYYKLLLQFLKVGGFPEMSFLPEIHHKQVLRDYVDVMLFRDVIERNKFSQEHLIREIYKFAASQSAQSFSVNKLNNDLKSRGFVFSKNLTYEVLEAFQDAYAIFLVPLYTNSIRKQQVNQKKIYNIDNGIRNLFSVTSDMDTGRRFENLVFIDLLRSGYEVFYYLTNSGGNEVDFIAIKNNRIRAIQCSLNSKTHEEVLEIEVQREVKKDLGVTLEYVYPESYLSFLGHR